MIMVNMKDSKGARTPGASIFRIRKTNPSADQHVIVKKLTDTTERSDSLDNVSDISWEDGSNSNGIDMLTIACSDLSTGEVQSDVDFWAEVSQARLQRDDPQTAESFSNLGIAQMGSKNFDAACSSFTTAAVIFGESHLGGAKNYNLLGLAACQANRLDLAMEALVMAFNVRSQVLEPFHVDTVDVLNNIAAVYYKLNDNLEAARCFREVLTIRKAIFGRTHPSVAVTAHALARTCVRLELKEEARELYFQALCICRLTKMMKLMKSDLKKEMKMLGLEKRPLFEL